MLNHALLQAAEQLSHSLLQQRLVLACAESCTGGLLAGTLTSIEGSSQWFDRGFVTYSNAAKQEHLGVATETLKQYGAVSLETAREMAQGVLSVCPDAHVAVSTTGIAGPGGAVPGKPVGFVCFGFALRTAQGVRLHAESQQFAGDRMQVRLASVLFAINALRALLQS